MVVRSDVIYAMGQEKMEGLRTKMMTPIMMNFPRMKMMNPIKKNVPRMKTLLIISGVVLVEFSSGIMMRNPMMTTMYPMMTTKNTRMIIKNPRMMVKNPRMMMKDLLCYWSRISTM